MDRRVQEKGPRRFFNQREPCMTRVSRAPHACITVEPKPQSAALKAVRGSMFWALVEPTVQPTLNFYDSTNADPGTVNKKIRVVTLDGLYGAKLTWADSTLSAATGRRTVLPR